MKVHIQLIVDEPNRVCVNGKEVSLEASLLIANHSPTGFNWGYHGSGPAQCALAICMELFGVYIGKRVYQQFKSAFVAEWQSEGEYQIFVAEFYDEYVVPVLEESLRDWAETFMWKVDSEAQADVIMDFEANVNPMQIRFFVIGVDFAIEQAKKIALENDWLCHQEGETWCLDANFPLTDTMFGIMAERSLKCFSGALTNMEQSFRQLADATKKISVG